MDNQTTAIKPSRIKKEALVAKFSDKLRRAKAVIFTNYQGMTHKQIENLKKAVKATNAEFVVTKNALLIKAMEKGELKILTQNQNEGKNKDEFKGPTAALFSFSDAIASIKELTKVIKLINLPVVKFGFFEGKRITNDDVVKLSKIPNREVLLAQLAFGLKSPIFGLHRALNWNLQKLVMTLKAISDKK